MNEEHIYTFPNGIKINCSDIIEYAKGSNVNDDDKIFIRHEIYYIDENGENKIFYY